MRTFFSLMAVAVVGSSLAACGSEDFTGAYRFKDSGMKGAMVLNIHGDEAEFFGDFGKGGIKPFGKIRVSVKDGKLLLDEVNGSLRVVMKRNVDERSLDCLNCKVMGLRKDDQVWEYDPKGPYDVDQMLKEQARKSEEALNAELEKVQQEAIEQGRRNAEAPKLKPYEGDWVYQRTTKNDPLTIMTIWRKSQIKSWSFNFENMDHRLGRDVPRFEITDAGLRIGDGPKAHLYTLSADKKILTCMDCTKSERWAKADPKKDLSDRYYARQMAGNP
ncbi:hypothetical protein QDY63_25145 [Pseudomonas brenneri]|uniref:hypothetical protein n=1 Tax=Pseudomonas fluorescens group TaxID=136843 RepID=UPI0021CCC76C|nr:MULTISPECIES: hypothetical protein [Pseudomonas fluorescens group]WJM90612.1 hypothetical protein QDY63_25145 [Pseudomonas brenneri]